MQEAEIYERLTRIFRDVFDNESIVLGAGTSAADVDGWNSLIHITLIAATESAFAVRFKSAELEQMDNVGDMVRLLMGKLGGPI
jgi:acyl carrier protein